MDDILTEAEIVALTGKVRHHAQLRELEHLGIKARPRSDGSLIVTREHRNAALGLRKAVRPVESSTAPNFAALDG